MNRARQMMMAVTVVTDMKVIVSLMMGCRYWMTMGDGMTGKVARVSLRWRTVIAMEKMTATK